MEAVLLGWRSVDMPRMPVAWSAWRDLLLAGDFPMWCLGVMVLEMEDFRANALPDSESWPAMVSLGATILVGGIVVRSLVS
jgi:hypothetical protein